MTDPKLQQHILDLEQLLASPSLRVDAALLDQLIADDFVEFGASGRQFTKADIIKLLMTESDFSSYDLLDFEVRPLGDTALIALYRIPARSGPDGSVKPGSLRSSVWKLSEGKWRLCFHQGTRTPEK